MKIADKNTKAVDLVREALEKAKQYEDYHCFISMNEARALDRAREIDEKIARGEKVGRLAGVPYALKDNYLSREGVTTAAARMLDNFPSPITSTAVAKLEAEGAIMMDLYAPTRIETDENNKVTALWTTPKMSSLIKGGRMNPADAGKEDVRIPCDIVLVAVGQGIEFRRLEDSGIPVNRGTFVADNGTIIKDAPGVFAGGDCVTGPKTAIRAIAAGKVAAANIDHYLGYNHRISVDVEIPDPALGDRPYCGRVNMLEREPAVRKNDFELMEIVMSEKESYQEASRCLRCDHFGCGAFKGGRKTEW